MADGRKRPVARLKGYLRDTEVVARLRARGGGPSPLSRRAASAAHNGLAIGYTNVAKKAAGAAAERMLAAMRAS